MIQITPQMQVLVAIEPVDQGFWLLTTVDRGVIHGHTTLAHHLLQITVADSIPAVPTHRPKDDLLLKLTPLEI
jgi:hypothetical protein